MKILIRFVSAIAGLILVAACQQATGTSDMEPRHSLLGTWTGTGICEENGQEGQLTATVTFGTTRWYSYHYCDYEGGFRYRPHGGTWSLDGSVLTRTNLIEDAPDTATKTITWNDDGQTFTAHPIHLEDDSESDYRISYSLNSRDSLPAPNMIGDWRIAVNDEVTDRASFTADGEFRYWYTWEHPSLEGVHGTFEATAEWEHADEGDGTIRLSGIEVTVTDSRYPGSPISMPNNVSTAVVGLAPGGSEPAGDANSIVLWYPWEGIIITLRDGESFRFQNPGAHNDAARTRFAAMVREE